MCSSSVVVSRRWKALAEISATSSTPAAAAIVSTCSMMRWRTSGAFIVGRVRETSSKAMVNRMPGVSSAGSGSESVGLSSASRIASSMSATVGSDSGG